MLLTACGGTPQQDTTASESKTESKTAQTEVKSITTADLVKNIDNKDYVIVDTRDDSYFNGYKDGDATRGGHIKNAVQFTSTWLDKISSSKFETFAEGKGITKDKTAVFYDTDKEALDKVVSTFADKGYKAEAYYDFKEYTAAEANPMEQFERYELLVNPQWVKDVTDGKKPEGYDSGEYMIFEVSWGEIKDSKDYTAEHIKGAYHFNTDWIEEGPAWNLSSPETVEKNLIANGISSDKAIILYSADASAGARALYALEWAGVKNVYYLNGGLDAWKAAGFPTETAENTPQAVASFGVTVPARPEIVLAMPQDVIAKEQSENIKLVSNRSWEEYTGKISGYDYIPRAGEPKGAIYGFSGTDASNLDEYYDPDRTFRNPNEMVALWDKQGIKKGEPIAFYCGTGWRSSVPWIMTQMIGWDNAVMYDGGWNAWQMDESLPVQEGAPNNMARPDAQNDYK